LRSSADHRSTGAIRLELLVVAIVLLLLATVLLASLRTVQGEVERTLVAAEVMSLRTELQLAAASAIGRGQESQLQHWPGRNPLELAGRPLVGESLPTSAGGARVGQAWRWAADEGKLVYEYEDGEQQILRVVRAGSGNEKGWGIGGGLLFVSEHRPPK
jgi:type II secretory pathway pseudopilin PulG